MEFCLARRGANSIVFSRGGDYCVPIRSVDDCLNGSGPSYDRLDERIKKIATGYVPPAAIHSKV
jgi:hypothetical protein